MRGWLAVALTLAACKGDRPAPAPSTQVAPTTTPVAVVVDAAPPAPAPAAPVALPDAIGLPAPLDSLRPHMKEGEVKAKLGALTQVSTRPPELVIPADVAVYAVEEGVVAYPSFYGGRLVGITLLSQPDTRLATPAHAKWGAGKPLEDASYVYEAGEAWPTTTAGWRVALHTGPNEKFHAELHGAREPKPRYAELSYRVDEPRKAEQAADNAPSFVAISKLLGQPLDAALTLFGDDLHREVADNEDKVAEADPTQGYGRVQLDGLDERWEVTLRTSKTSQRIDYILLAGDADDHAALLKRLEAAFGARRAVVNEVGDVVIGFGGRSDVHASKVGDSWEIELRR